MAVCQCYSASHAVELVQNYCFMLHAFSYDVDAMGGVDDWGGDMGWDRRHGSCIGVKGARLSKSKWVGAI